MEQSSRVNPKVGVSLTKVTKKVITRKIAFGWALNSCRRRFTIENKLRCKSKTMIIMFKEWQMSMLPRKYSWYNRALEDKTLKPVLIHTVFFF